MIQANEAFLKISENFSIDKHEIISTQNALGYKLFDDILAIKNLPAFDNSALDGYAVKFDEQKNGYVLKDSIFAGEKKELSINGNECVKIMTGAPFPKGADSVIRLEDAIQKDGKIYANSNFKKGDAHRFLGEETKVGEILITKNTTLTPIHIMYLAAQGITHVKVYKKPKIAIFSSGDELKEPWEWADELEIYNANAYGVASLLSHYGFSSDYLGIIKDDLDTTINSFKQIDGYDVVFCSGGASKGEADYMKTALVSLGYTEIFSRINIRPGGPCKAFTKDNKLIFILPGNPMAAYLCAFLFALPVLLGKEHDKVVAKAMQEIKLKQGRANVVLGSVNFTQDECEFHITDNNNFGSGMIKPLIKSNALYLSDATQDGIKKDSVIKVIRFS